MPISDVCNKNVVCIDKSDPVLQAAKLMRQYHVGDVVVTEKQQGKIIPIAILTDRDLVIEMLAKEIEIDSILVEDIMSRFLISANENEEIFEVVNRMCEKGIRRIPITNRQEELVGIFTIDDLLKLLAQQQTNVAYLISKEQHQERLLRE